MRRIAKTHTVRRLFALFLATLALFSLASCKRGSDVPKTPGLSLIEGEPIYDEGVAMKTDNYTVTQGMMAFFFYSYGGAKMLEMEQLQKYDSSKTLHEQEYLDGISWYDTIMNATLSKVSQMLIYCEAARDAGVSLSEEQNAAIEEELSSMRLDAAAAYSLTLEAYLKQEYGPHMTEHDMKAVLECEMLASIYSVTVNRTLEEGLTRSSIENCMREQGFDDKTLSRNMAYLRIPYVNGQKNDAKAGEVRTSLLNDPRAETLESFKKDGIFAHELNLTPDNTTVREIGAWLFADGREIGDRGEIEVENATYILLYTGNGVSFGEVSAKMHLYDEAYAAWYNSWVAALTFGYNYDVLDSYDVS